ARHIGFHVAPTIVIDIQVRPRGIVLAMTFDNLVHKLPKHTLIAADRAKRQQLPASGMHGVTLLVSVKVHAKRTSRTPEPVTPRRRDQGYVLTAQRGIDIQAANAL